MRRIPGRLLVLLAIAALVLVALVPASAGDSKPETRQVVPLEVGPFPVWNPCTGEDAWMTVTGDWYIHALPSIDSFWDWWFNAPTPTLSHVNTRFFGQAVGDDGYATKWKHMEAWVVNLRDSHYVETEAENLMIYGDDGGKYRVRIRVKATVVDGDIKVSSEMDKGVCIRYPTG